MKLAVEHEFVSMSEGLPTSSFQIKASSKAFKILSSGLYSDKIKAIIRELSTNAYDSHVANGNADEPFDVFLPTYLKPEFYIRDYGTGLTPEEIKTVYTVYFESNKIHSNDFTGCLGLGSKSPFSYTKNFTVESFKDGMHYIYSAHHDEYGCPAITLMSEQSTTERNGLKISLAINSGDINRFTEKAREVYRHFKTPPKMVGNICKINLPKINCEGSGWKFYSDDGYSTAIMGNVEYPITHSSEFSARELSFLGLRFELNFNIGELEFEAGREHLSIDKKTIATIKARIRVIEQEINDKFINIYDDCHNLFEARIKYVQIRDSLGSLTSFITLPSSYKGKEVYNGSYVERTALDIVGLEMLTLYKENYNRGVKQKISKYIELNDYHRTKFVLNDLKIGAIRRCQEFCRNNEGIHLILFKFNTPTAKQEFLDIVGCDSSCFIPASALDKPQRNARQSNGHKLEKICLFKNKTCEASSHCWENVDKDLKEGGIYVELNRGKVVVNNRHDNASFLKPIVDALSNINKLPSLNIYGIKTVLIPKVVTMSQWSTLKEEAKLCLDKYLDLFEKYKLLRDRSELGINTTSNIEKILTLKVNTSEIIELKELWEKTNDADYQSVLDFQKLYIFVHGKEYQNEENVLDKAYNTVIIRYPLLKYMDWRRENTDFEDYINLVNKESK